MFRVDASRWIGWGHVMRCLTLAGEIARRGGRSIFVTAELSEPLADAIARGGHGLHAIATTSPPADENWEASPILPPEQRAQAASTAKIASEAGATHLVVDHYRLDREFTDHPGLRGLRTLVIDDLANRHLSCDFLLDQTVGRDPCDYRPLARGATLLVGGSYALLRPQFAARRSAAMRRRTRDQPVRRLLISLGSTDIGGRTGRAVEIAIACSYRGAIDVVLDRSAPSRPVVETLAARHAGITLHSDVDDMAALMVAADLAIGAAGTTTWERCALGLPTVTLILANNQRVVAEKVSAAGAAVAVEDVEQVGTVLIKLMSGRGLAAMSTAGFGLVDGYGAVRVADALLASPSGAPAEPSIRLRAADHGDSPRLLAWRNDPVTRTQSRSHDEISAETHERWFAASLASATRRIWMAERAGVPVASTRTDDVEDDAVVSIMVAPDARGGGVGRAALAATCANWDATRSGDLRAFIHEANTASIRIFRRCGFAPMDNVSPEGFRAYVRASPTTSDLEACTR